MARLILLKRQNLWLQSSRLQQVSEKLLQNRQYRVKGSMLTKPDNTIKNKRDYLESLSKRLSGIPKNYTEKQNIRLNYCNKTLDNLSYKKTLARGFAMVLNDQGQPLKSIDDWHVGKDHKIIFSDQSEKLIRNH